MLLQNGMEIEERDFFKDPFSQEEIEVLALHEGLGYLFAQRSPSLKNWDWMARACLISRLWG